jgi:hypothetical protein
MNAKATTTSFEKYLCFKQKQYNYNWYSGKKTAQFINTQVTNLFSKYLGIELKHYS